MQTFSELFLCKLIRAFVNLDGARVEKVAPGDVWALKKLQSWGPIIYVSAALPRAVFTLNHRRSA